MNIQDLVLQISELSAVVEREIAEKTIVAANDMAQSIKARVLTGENDTGGNFTPYSNTPVPAYWYFDKSRTATAERKVRSKATKKEDISYKDFREINNLETNKKIFEFTGEMWRHFGVLATQKGIGFTNVTIGGQTDEAKKKIAVSSAREGVNITNPNAAEIAFAEQSLQTWIGDVWDSTLQ